MSVAKIQEALDRLESLDDLLQDVSPALLSRSNWEELTHLKLKSLRRILENELVHQEKRLLARYGKSNTGLPPTDGDVPQEVKFKLPTSG